MVVLAFVSGALWRRWLGGALGKCARVWKFLALLVLCTGICWDYPLYILLVFGLLSAWFTIKHDNGGEGWYWLRRYGPFGAGYMLKQFNVRTPVLGATEWAELWLGGTTIAFVSLAVNFIGG